jgi:hypothetical protein
MKVGVEVTKLSTNKQHISRDVVEKLEDDAARVGAAQEPIGQGEFEVFVNPEFAEGDLSSFAETFAGWAPEEESTRQFKPADVRSLLARMENDDSVTQVLTQPLNTLLLVCRCFCFWQILEGIRS